VPVDLGVKVMVQLAELPLEASSTPMLDRLQVRRAGKPEFMESRTATCPVGVVGEEPVSVTVIVQVIASPTVSGLGLQEMEVWVRSLPLPAVDSAKVPELPALFVSPPYEAAIVAPPPWEGV
jgi:hypothetical protein